jgi:hypothetical protein
MVCAEEDGHEGQPDDTGGVHREPDVFCLVEVLCRSKDAFVKDHAKTRTNVVIDFSNFWEKILSMKPPPLTLGYERKEHQVVNCIIWVSPPPPHLLTNTITGCIERKEK